MIKSKTPFHKWSKDFDPKSSDGYSEHKIKMKEIQNKYGEFFEFYLGNMYNISSTDIHYREVKVIDKMTQEEVIFFLSIYDFLDEEKNNYDLVLPHFYRYINKYQNRDIIDKKFHKEEIVKDLKNCVNTLFNQYNNNNITNQIDREKVVNEIENKIIEKYVDSSTIYTKLMNQIDTLDIIKKLDINNERVPLSDILTKITDSCKEKYIGQKYDKITIRKILNDINNIFNYLDINHLVQVFTYQSKEDIELNILNFCYCDYGDLEKRMLDIRYKFGDVEFYT